MRRAIRDWFDADDQERLQVLASWRNIGMVGIGVGILFLLVGATYQWHHGAGQDSIVVGVLWRIVWITYTVAKLALVGLLALALSQFLRQRRGRPES